MKNLWNYIETRNWKMEKKYKAAVWIVSIISAAAGFIAWLAVRTWVLSSLTWMICFIGCPVVISWFVILFYSCSHDFHDGTYPPAEKETSAKNAARSTVLSA